MACRGCNETPAMTREQVENLIQRLIDSGKLQGGLQSCDGETLSPKAKVLLCSQIAEKVNELITNGTIKVVKSVKIEDGNLIVTDGTGAETKTKLAFAEDLQFDATTNKLTWKEGGERKEATLPYLKGVATEKALVVTLPDGSTAEVPKTGSTLTEDSFDDTIEKGVNQPNKFGLKMKSNGGLERTLNGVAVRLGDGLAFDWSGALTIGEVFAEKPLKGKGTRSEPLSITLSDRDFNVNPVTGEISLKTTQNLAVTNLNDGIRSLGYSTFYGEIDKAGGKYIAGVPPKITSQDNTQNSTNHIGELADGERYDFNGWQIASPVQVDQYLVGADNVVWHRTNEQGAYDDGAIKDHMAWSAWNRETNVNVSMVQLQAMQNTINDYGRRIAILEHLLENFVPLKDASGTETIGFIKP